MNTTAKLDPDALYRALCARDARFDGLFFVGVRSTGVYCRPICRVRTPQQVNCRFFAVPAQAEAAGCRPCLRCRPELAPLDRHWSGEDAASIMMYQAIAWFASAEASRHEPAKLSPLSRAAQRLGISERHLRRVFDKRLGVSPLQYLQTQRLLSAKQLLTDTCLPVADVAEVTGYGSVRRLQAAFADRYGMSPNRLRRGARPSTGLAMATVRLAWRPPHAIENLLGFFATRAITGLELVDCSAGRLQRSLRISSDGREHVGWLQAQFVPATHQVLLGVSEGLVPALPEVIRRARAAFDLDADPQAIDAVLHNDFPDSDGVRVPGGFDGFEIAVRAVLGQQLTLGAARTMTQRLVARWGDPLVVPSKGLSHLFPSPQALLTATAGELGGIGIVRQRQVAIAALARAVLDGQLCLESGSPPQKQIQTLLELPGIGPWTANYIAMRALRWPDAWPSGDVVLHKALGLQDRPKRTATQDGEHMAQRWRPWRSYAAVRAWAQPTPRSLETVK